MVSDNNVCKKEESSDLVKDLLPHFSQQAKNIIEGSYDKSEEMYKYTNSNKYPAEVTDFAENFCMMAVKLEAREFSLENTIEDLKTKQLELEESIKIRSEFSFVFIIFVSFICFYLFVVSLVQDPVFINPADVSIFNSIVNIVFVITLIILSGALVKKSNLPIAEFGLTFKNSLLSIKESLLITVLILIPITLFKVWAIYNLPEFAGKTVFDFSVIDWTFFTYLIISPTQEFLGRGVFQGSIQRILLGKHKVFWAVTMSALIFGAFHIFYSTGLAILAALSGFLWGWLYTRHKTIIGISISHFIIGNYLMLLDFWKYLAD